MTRNNRRTTGSRSIAALCFVLACLMAGRSLAADKNQASPDAEARFNTGRAHLIEGRPQLALDEFKEAVRLDAKNPYFLKGLGQAHLALKRYSDAAAAFRKALELNPNYSDARNDLATALALSGRREEAKKEFMTALNDPMNPTPEITARNLGQAYFDEKNYPEALNWFRTAINRNKAYAEAYVRLADTLVVTGRLDEAVAQLEIAVKDCRDDLLVVLALGETYYQSGRFADARTRLELVAAKDPVGASGRRAAELLKKFPK